MATVIKTRIVKIGNSQGVRIPKTLLEQANLEENERVELELEDDQIVIRSAFRARRGWDKAFRAMANQGDDTLLDDDMVSATTWDDEEWEW